MAKVLFADDEQVFRDIYTKEFEKEGYEVQTASDGEEVLKKVEEFKPDLLLMDIHMPRIDGLSTLKKLKENEATKHMPVIMLSNQTEVKMDVEQAISMGAASYLVKSDITLKDVLAKVREVIGGSTKSDMKMY